MASEKFDNQITPKNLGNEAATRVECAIDEAKLLKDWDFEKFFPNSSNKNRQSVNSTSKNVNKNTTKENGVRIRTFRRENSDFFPLPKSRHSAIIFDKSANNLLTKNNRRESDCSSLLVQRDKTEPILPEFKKNASRLLNGYQNVEVASSYDYLKPRREKTETEIVFRNSLSKNLELKRKFFNADSTTTTTTTTTTNTTSTIFNHDNKNHFSQVIISFLKSVNNCFFLTLKKFYHWRTYVFYKQNLIKTGCGVVFFY